MRTIKAISTSGEEVTLKVNSIISIDGKSSQPDDSGILNRLAALEQAFVALMGERLQCLNPESSSVVSTSPVTQVVPQLSLDQSQVAQDSEPVDKLSQTSTTM